MSGIQISPGYDKSVSDLGIGWGRGLGGTPGVPPGTGHQRTHAPRDVGLAMADLSDTYFPGGVFCCGISHVGAWNLKKIGLAQIYGSKRGLDNFDFNIRSYLGASVSCQKPFLLWAMGSIDPQSPFWCCNGDCGRRGWLNVNWLPGFSARSATEKKRAIETPSLDYVPVCHAAGECLLNVILICMVAWRCGRWSSCVAVVGRTSVRASVASQGGLNQGGFAPPIITAVGTCRFWTEGSPAEAILYTVSRVWIWIGMPW